MAEECTWLCECGASLDQMDANWRCAGAYWEHYHGYPIGHVRTKFVTMKYVKEMRKNILTDTISCAAEEKGVEK